MWGRSARKDKLKNTQETPESPRGNSEKMTCFCVAVFHWPFLRGIMVTRINLARCFFVLLKVDQVSVRSISFCPLMEAPCSDSSLQRIIEIPIKTISVPFLFSSPHLPGDVQFNTQSPQNKSMPRELERAMPTYHRFLWEYQENLHEAHYRK